jgi:outer membrane protein assembly factor BamB
MSTHDILDTLLPDLEGPVPPDPEFTARLRRTFVAASGHQPTTRPESVPVRPADRAPITLRPPRRRWLDLAAVAVLLLSMIGGIARVTDTTTTPTTAIQAPGAIHDGEMVGSSAAGDGQVWGPAPSAARYERLWATEPGTAQSVIHGAAAFGSHVFRIPGVGDQQNLGELSALDLRTGAVDWTTKVDVSLTATVTSSGVIVALGEDADSIKLALLDLDTGHPIWMTSQTFSPVPSRWTVPLIVADGTVLLSTNDGAYYAFDLKSGRQLWYIVSPRIIPIGMPVQVCYDSENCIGRSDTDVSMVAANGTLYVSDLATAEISAHSIQTGQELWAVSTADRSGSSNINFASLIAVDTGVIIALQDPMASDFTPVVYWGLWSATDGHEVWKGTLSLGDARMMSNGTSLYALFKDPARDKGTCCDIAEIDVVSGVVTWSQGVVSPRSLEGYLSDEDTLMLRALGSGESIQGLNIRTHATDWTLSLSVTGCYSPMFPLSPDGLLPCLSNIGQLAVYQPIRLAATPSPVAPVAEEQPVMALGSAAMDGSWPGPAPASGDYRLLWRGEPPATGFVAPFRGKIYQIVQRMSPTSAQALVAYGADSGAELWSQPVTPNFAFAVTSAGVVVGIPDSFGGQASPAAGGGIWDFHVVLLDLETGQPIWRSAEVYQLNSQFSLDTTQVAGDTILFIDGQLTLVVLDLATGQERWRVESSTPPPAKCSCPGVGPAIAGDTVYFDNPVTGQIVAVSLSSGEQKWAVDDPVERTTAPQGGAIISGPIVLGAMDQGVVVNTWWLPGGNATGTFGLLSAADGSPIWEWGTDKPVQDFARVGDALIVITRDPGETDWRLERVDLATGQVLLSSAQTFRDALYLQLLYLPEADLLLVSTPETIELVGVNPGSLAVTWTAPAIADCRILLPVASNGNLACRTKSGLAVYQPVTAQNAPATPVGSSR